VTAALLRVEGLEVGLPRGGAVVPVVSALDLSVSAGEMLALVGESGSGKTTACLAIPLLLPAGARVGGRVLLAGRDLLALDARALRAVRGREIGMVFQDPLAALNPVLSVGAQIAEPFRLHERAGVRAGRAHAVDLLREVGVADAAARIDDFPYQFSGGMRQRVMIAVALSAGPSLLIADEPVSGLDAESAAQIMALLARLRRSRGVGVLCVTHDLGVVERHADTVQVLYAGRCVERAPAGRFFAGPLHPYSQALLGCVPWPGRNVLTPIAGRAPAPEEVGGGCRFAPRCAAREAACDAAYPTARSEGEAEVFCVRPGVRAAVPAKDSPRHVAALGDVRLELRDVSVIYRRRRWPAVVSHEALRDVSLAVRQGECLGIVGASGSGKSTLGRAVLQMQAYAGRICLDGVDLGALPARARRRAARRIAVVFQDPRASLNPRLSVAAIVGEPLLLMGMADRAARRRRVDAVLEQVGLGARMGDALPGALSGGQAQRVAIARALAAGPAVIVFDEPCSALDVSTQAGLLMLLRDLKQRDGLTSLLISHDAAVVGFLADRVVRLRDGRVVQA
jgi:oligopeptide/dipeptide ABC transporter ATP-binding protein